MKHSLVKTQDYLLLIDEEAEIKYNTIIFESDTCLINVVGKGYVHNKTDFKIIAYYPLTKEAKELDRLLLLPNPFKNKKECYNKDAIIKAFYTDSREWKNRLQDYIDIDFESWFEEKIKGNKEYIETNHFTLDDVKKAIEMAREYEFVMYGNGETEHKYSEDEIIQSLSTQQTYPKEFIPEYQWKCPLTGNWLDNPELSIEVCTEKRIKRVYLDEKIDLDISTHLPQQLVGTYKF